MSPNGSLAPHPKRIVVVDSTITRPLTGGAQTFLIDLCQALVQEDWAVTVVTQPGPEAAVVRMLVRSGVLVRSDLWGSIHLPEDGAVRLAKWVNAYRPDVFVVSISPDVAWLALPLLDASIATISIVHNDVPAFYEPLKHYHSFVDRAIGVSNTAHRKIITQYGVSAGRATQIPYGVRSLPAQQAQESFARVPNADTGLGIVYVGRLVTEQKRILDFALLASELLKREVRFQLHMIGEGSERRVFEAELRKRQLQGHVRVWGWLAPDEVMRRLPELDAFVLMSEYEGLSVALLEAMANAVVPVVTEIESGNVEVVKDGRNGFVVPVGDIQLFADRLEELGRKPELLRVMKKAAWETSQEYSLGRMISRYVACFSEVAQRSTARRYRDVVNPFPVMPGCRSRYPKWLRRMKRRIAGP